MFLEAAWCSISALTATTFVVIELIVDLDSTFTGALGVANFHAY
jgi:hypothetical protein